MVMRPGDAKGRRKDGVHGWWTVVRATPGPWQETGKPGKRAEDVSTF